MVSSLEPSSFDIGRGKLPARGIIAQQAWQRQAVAGPSASLQPARRVQVSGAVDNLYASNSTRAQIAEQSVLGKYGVLSPRKIEVRDAPQIQNVDDWHWDVATGMQLQDPYHGNGGGGSNTNTNTNTANSSNGLGGGGGGPGLSSFGVTHEAGLMANFEESYMLRHGDDHNTYTWDNQAWAEGALAYPGRVMEATSSPRSRAPPPPLSSSSSYGGVMTASQSRLTKPNSVFDPFADGTAYV